MKMNKDLETDTKRVKALVEKDKSVLQKKHAKILKKSEKEGYEVLKQFQTTQQTFTCSKSAIKTLEKGVKYVQG